MCWKILEKIISRGKKKDTIPIGQENTLISTPDSSSSDKHEVKIKKVKDTTIKIKDDGKQILPMDSGR